MAGEQGLQIWEGELWGVKMWELPPLWDSALLSGACDEKKMETLGMMGRVSGGGGWGGAEWKKQPPALQVSCYNGAHLLAQPSTSNPPVWWKSSHLQTGSILCICENLPLHSHTWSQIWRQTTGCQAFHHARLDWWGSQQLKRCRLTC